MTTRVAIIPGNGHGDVECMNWYGWVRDKLSTVDNVECVLRNMPDPVLAREQYWIPFMAEELKCNEDTIIIGHSSGAEAAMRYAEKYKIRGIILVSAYVSDLGDRNEKASGYFNRPWEWKKMKENLKFVVQFGSTDDPFIPWDEQQAVADGLDTELHKYSDKGHFMSETFPEVIKTIKQYLDV